MHTDGQHAPQRLDEVAAAALLHRQDRLATRAGVAAEREHRNLRVDAGVHHNRLLGGHRQLFAAGVTPPGRGRAAAPTFQRQDEVEHPRQCAAWG